MNILDMSDCNQIKKNTYQRGGFYDEFGLKGEKENLLWDVNIFWGDQVVKNLK